MIKLLLRNRVFKNFSYLTIGGIISQLIGVITLAKTTSLLSPANYGIFTFITAQGTLLFNVGDLGATSIITRNIGRDHNLTKDLVFNGAIVRFLAVLFFMLIYLVYNYFTNTLTFAQVLLAAAFALVSCWAQLFQSAFSGHQKMRPVSVINILYSLIWFAAVYLFPAQYVTVTSLFVVFLLANTLKAGITIVALKSQGLLVGRISNFWESSKSLVAQCWPYFSLVLIETPVHYLSSNFLELNSNSTEVGYFNLSQKLLLPVTWVFVFALTALSPNLASMWVKSEARFRQFIASGFKYFVAITAFLSFAFAMLIREVVLILFKASYLPAVKVCQLQVWFEFLMVVCSFIGITLGAIDKQKLVLKLGIINAIISTPMLYIGSKYGALGISHGYLISFAIFQLYCWWRFKKALSIQIKDDFLFWGFAIALFAISYFVPQDTAFIYRLLIVLVVGGGFGAYHLKPIRTLLEQV